MPIALLKRHGALTGFQAALAIIMTRDGKMARTEVKSGGERPEQGDSNRCCPSAIKSNIQFTYRDFLSNGLFVQCRYG